MKSYMIAAAAMLGGTAALAQTVPATPPARPMADHVMTRAETVQMVRDHFARFDSDRDGAISTAEITAHRGQRMAMRSAPGGQPHVMVRKRAARDPGAAFDRLDSNKDGMISRDEFTKGREMRIEKRVVRHEKIREARTDGKLGGVGMHRMGRMGGARMIVMADSNHDGRITLPEAEAMALQHFDRMDANHDGSVTPAERGAGRRIIIKEIREGTPDAG